MSYYGPESLLTNPRAAVLNSRQSKYPVGADPWIQATQNAVADACGRGMTIVTSTGMNTWELVLALASSHGAEVLVVLPNTPRDTQQAIAEILRQYKLDAARTGFLFPDTAGMQTRKAAWPERDLAVAETADLLLPVSIRKGGSLDKLIGKYRHKVRDSFAVPHRTPRRPRPRYDQLDGNPALIQMDLLAHFTRSTASPWPDETAFDYYHAVVSSGTTYCRSACAALLHILRTGIIFGSSRHIREGHRVVAFTALSPDNYGVLFRYRPRLVNPGFEPYGIGITRKKAADLGLRPVLYGTPEAYATLADDDKPFFQNVGRHDGQWRAEHEWRCPGDLHLDRVAPNFLRVLISTEEESAVIEKYTNISVTPLFAAGN